MKKMVSILCYRWHPAVLIAASVILVSGCASRRTDATAGYTPQNVFSPVIVLPQNVKRLAVLPLVADESNPTMVDGREIMETVLNEELIKIRKFEITSVSPQFLKGRTGRRGWTSEEVLPADLLSSLRETYGCDAVLFSQLTLFRPYAPIAVGWRMKLIDARTQQVLWAGDEALDADQIRSGKKSLSGKFHDSWTMNPEVSNPVPLNSPRMFGRYSVAQLLATMPKTSAELFGAPEGGKSF